MRGGGGGREDFRRKDWPLFYDDGRGRGEEEGYEGREG